MNKEYIYLSSEEMLVIDEHGKPTKRSVENYNMHELLKAENNLESIVNTINNLEKSLNQATEFSSYSRQEKIFTCLFPLTPAVIAIGAGALFGGLSLNQILFIGIPTSCVTAFTLFGLPFMLREREKIKCNKGIHSELEKTYILKESYEKKLSSIKSKVEEREVVTSFNQEIVSIEDSMKVPNEDIEQLIDAFEQGYGRGAKKLILKK